MIFLYELSFNPTKVISKEYKKEDIKITYGYGKTPFGEAFIAFTPKDICYLGFIDDDKDEIFTSFKKIWKDVNLLFDNEKAKEYLENIFLKNKKYDLLVKGTTFQMSVWKALLNLPFGVVTTYQEVANTLEKPKSVRAVASAIGKNHIAYLIPCHRVIAKSGAMSGYRWGIQRKKILIAYESNSKD